MTASDPKEWMKEYSEFLNAEEMRVPTDLNQKVLEDIQALLNPNAWFVFIKILGIHLIVGFFSLAICHQFGMNPFRTERSLADWFMDLWGHSACMVGCGVVFVSLSIFAAGYFLTIEEVKALKRTEFLQIISLGAVSLVLFAILGSELAIDFAGLWLLGALIGGYLATETMWRIKTFFLVQAQRI
jgi:hypothetical protein